MAYIIPHIITNPIMDNNKENVPVDCACKNTMLTIDINNDTISLFFMFRIIQILLQSRISPLN